MLAAHCYLPAHNKSATTSHEDSIGDYDKNNEKIAEDNRQEGGGLPGWGM